MRDCGVPDAGPRAAYDHVGERDFDDADGALRRKGDLNRLAGRGALDISVRIKYHG